mmetsp:Transcript_4325/g.15926  ORF Transcript_4325/g.15926 Transcript_4325/m.15926 type:complete len:317 (-) Transcript_4325:728-1678(-)
MRSNELSPACMCDTASKISCREIASCSHVLHSSTTSSISTARRVSVKLRLSRAVRRAPGFDRIAAQAVRSSMRSASWRDANGFSRVDRLLSVDTSGADGRPRSPPAPPAAVPADAAAVASASAPPAGAMGSTIVGNAADVTARSAHLATYSPPHDICSTRAAFPPTCSHGRRASSLTTDPTTSSSHSDSICTACATTATANAGTAPSEAGLAHCRGSGDDARENGAPAPPAASSSARRDRGDITSRLDDDGERGIEKAASASADVDAEDSRKAAMPASATGAVVRAPSEAASCVTNTYRDTRDTHLASTAMCARSV